MAAGKQPATAIALHGTPELTEGLALVPMPDTLPVFEIDLPSRDIGPPLLGQVERAGTGATYLRLVLPEDTPPGEYHGTVRLGDSDHPVIVNVEGEEQLRFGRTGLDLAGALGEDIPITVDVVNVGNLPVTIGRADAVGLFEIDSIDRRIHEGLRNSKAGGSERLVRILDGLAESDGGLARISIKKGSGRLGLDETRTLSASLRPDQRCRPGTTYQGTWSLHGADLALRVTIKEGARAK